jgi:hypothetical protein
MLGCWFDDLVDLSYATVDGINLSGSYFSKPLFAFGLHARFLFLDDVTCTRGLNLSLARVDGYVAISGSISAWC